MRGSVREGAGVLWRRLVLCPLIMNMTFAVQAEQIASTR